MKRLMGKRKKGGVDDVGFLRRGKFKKERGKLPDVGQGHSIQVRISCQYENIGDSREASMSTILNKPNEFEHRVFRCFLHLNTFPVTSPNTCHSHFSKYTPYPLSPCHVASLVFSFYCRPLNQMIRFSSQITCTERLWMLAAHNSTNAAFFACESNPLPCERSIERKKEK